MNYPLRLSSETLAMLMIGDGVLAMAQPRRHVNLWRVGPEPWREALSFFDRRPGLTAAIGALEVGAGLWLASRQRPARRLRH